MPVTDIIIIGTPTAPLYRFEADSLVSITGVRGVDVVGNQLSVDELTPTVTYLSGEVIDVFAPRGYNGILAAGGYLFGHSTIHPDLRTLPYGTPVYHYRDGALWGKYYSRNVERAGRTRYTVHAMSAVGILDRTKHLGGIYTGQTFEAVVTDIIGAAVPFTVAGDVKELPVYGLLPYASRRSNLHQLLFATGVAVRRNADGDMHFAFLAGETAKEIPDGRIYYGGDVDYSTPATGVEVTEHSYSQIATVEPVTLFDNTDGAAASNTFVAFTEAPVHSLAVTGTLRIVSSGVNWARVTGVGTLTGKPYVHTTRTVSMEADNAAQLGEPNVIPVEDVTLINQQNSYNVARRLLSYYSSAKTVREGIVLQGEGPGDLLSLSDPFGEATSAFVSQMEINVSGVVRADCTLIADYTPVKETPQFNRLQILTGTGDYTVPAGVTMLRVAILQAGDGGSSGEYGAAAEAPETGSSTDTTGSPGAYTYWYKQYSYAKLGGAGGLPGQPGQGGKVLVVDIPVTPGQVIHFACGVGGLGGVISAAGSQPGQAGGESAFGAYSSADGDRAAGGWAELLSGKVYAHPGRFGVAGGRGSGQGTNESGQRVTVEGETITVDGVAYRPGASSGMGTVKETHQGDYSQGQGYYRSRVYGSYGGGPAYGAMGNAGLEASAGSVSTTSSSATAVPPPGGDGAAAQPFPAATDYGSGGPGGNGGGGAGASGNAIAENRILQGLSRGTLKVNQPAQPAQGGAPSAGSQGAPGAVFVYFTAAD